LLLSNLIVTFYESYDSCSCYAAENAADLTADTFVHSKNPPNQQLCYDFGDRRITLTHYSIWSRHDGDTNNFYPKSWVIEISKDDSTWEEVDRRENDSSLTGPNLAQLFKVSRSAECLFARLHLRKRIRLLLQVIFWWIRDLKCSVIWFETCILGRKQHYLLWPFLQYYLSISNNGYCHRSKMHRRSELDLEISRDSIFRHFQRLATSLRKRMATFQRWFFQFKSTDSSILRRQWWTRRKTEVIEFQVGQAKKNSVISGGRTSELSTFLLPPLTT
jgi:hypothetical protein